MSQRYGPPPRDRSPPPRHFDRRPSTTYRASNETAQSPLDRAPPRGPKADNFRGAYHASTTARPRGGFASRPSDTWDRERDRERDPRNPAPPYRRDEDRPDWPRRDRDFSARDRPATVDRRDSVRERSASPERPRRNSRESIASSYGRPTDPPSSTYYSPSTRGGLTRGRGRGDWDRSRGRSSFIGDREREGFYPRSRSRDGWRERDYERGRTTGDLIDRQDRFERRDYDRTDDREARPRDHEPWQRERSPARSSTGRPVSPGALSNISHGAPERSKSEYEANRKPTNGPLSSRSDSRRETDTDYFGSRTESSRRDGPPSATFSQSSIPQGASLGLDYGPPASIPATTPSAAEKTTASKPHLSRSDPTQNTQPPSAPKAERGGLLAATSPAPRPIGQQSDQRSSQRQPPPGGTLLHNPIEPSLKPTRTSPDLRTSSMVGTDKAMPANVPSGPRIMSAGSYKSRPPEQLSPTAPPTAPRQPKAIETRPMLGAPTGPRSAGFMGPAGSQSGANRAWGAPEYRPKGPSIMNQLAKPYAAEARDRSSYMSTSRPSVGHSNPPRSGSITGSTDLAAGASPVKPERPQSPLNEDEDMLDAEMDVGLSMPASDDDDVEDDEAFDEDYFATSEETHAREMKLLEARKPLSTVQDPVTAALLIRLQLLNMIVQGVVPRAYEEAKKSAHSEGAMDLDVKPESGPLSPQRTPEHDVKAEIQRPRGRPLGKPFVNPIPTPPIDDLPYLNRAVQNLSMGGEAQPEDPVIFPDSEDEERQLKVIAMLEQDLEKQSWKAELSLEQSRESYMKRYPKWKEDNEIHERRLREVHQPSPAPASPAPSATPSLPTGPERSGIERTRGARNTTDLDIQQAILMSQQSAKEEEERREKEAASSALPNYDTEAVVPFMLRSSEAETDLFEDTSHQIPQVMALEFMAYVPPEDDFTDEEQLSFIAAFCQNPKKWGKIAESIPGRTFQDCITHYYLTKDQANYKEHWRRSQPKRRRGRQAVKPRANNLMSDLALNEDKEGTPAAVTDSGRPRRAAAPTFGDSNDADSSNNGASAKRGAKDGVEVPATKPTRGRRAGMATKTRRTKEKILADQQAHNLGPASAEASPQKGAVASKDKGRTLLKAESTPKLEALNNPAVSAQIAIDPLRTAPSEMGQTTVSAPVAPVVTSYWSVQEHQIFPQLVKYYGRDFGAIAAFLKTKSSTMIKNYFIREVNKEGKVELEQFADEVEAKKARGEALGPPPTPVQPPKRRYEATPSMANVTRAPISGTEQMHHEIEQLSHNPKPLVEDFPANSIQRNATGEVVAKPRPPREILQPNQQQLQMQPKVEEPIRSDRPMLLQKPAMQGPPRGYFQDEKVGYQPRIHRPQENIPHQQQHAQFDPRVADPAQQQYTHQRLGPSAVQQSREQLIQPHRSDRTHPGSGRGHSRDNSSVNPSQAAMETAAADLASLRGAVDPPRGMLYGGPAVPVSMPMNHVGQQHQRTEQSKLSQEPPKPQPAKRSNVFSILNDDPPEPPAKRASTDSAKRSVNTPPPPIPTSLSGQSSQLQPSRHIDELPRSIAQYPHVSRYGPIGQEYPAGHSSSPAPGPATDLLDKYDPHQQIQQHEPRSMHQSPALSPYSVIPPSSRADPNANIPGRYEPRGLEQGSHRRSYLGIGSAPSPPPQLPASIQPHRSLSAGGSQHGRGSSLVYPPPPPQQQPPHGQPQVTASQAYPPASSSTPVGALHRNQASVDYNASRRLTIQEHLREQQQQQREHELVGQRRDVEMMQHSQQNSQRPPPSTDRRDVYGTDQLHPSAQHHQPPPPSHTPQPQHVGMGYSTQPPRTYTPPHGAYGASPDQRGSSHGHHQSQHSHHQAGPPPLPPQQSRAQPPPYGAPQPPQHRPLGADPRGPLGPPPSQQPPQPPQQPQHHHHHQPPPPATHYRSYGQNQDERR